MNVAEFVGGAAVTIVIAGALGLGAFEVRRRFLADWRGAAARVAEAVLALGALTLVLELLGIAGILERWSIVVASLAAGGVGVAVARRAGSTDLSRPCPPLRW